MVMTKTKRVIGGDLIIGGAKLSLSKAIRAGERRLDVVEFIFLVRAFGADPAALIARVEQAFPTRGKRK